MTYAEICQEIIPGDTQFTLADLMKFANEPLSVSVTVPLDDGGTFTLVLEPTDSADFSGAPIYEVCKISSEVEG